MIRLNSTRIRILSSHDLRAEHAMPGYSIQLIELKVLITTRYSSKGCDIEFIMNVYDIFNLCRFDSGEVHTKQRFMSV